MIDDKPPRRTEAETLAEEAFDKAEQEVRSLASEETLEKLDAITYPHKLEGWANLQLFRNLAVYVASTRAGRGNLVAYMQRQRTVGLELLPDAKEKAEELRTALQTMLDEQLFDELELELMVWELDHWIPQLGYLEQILRDSAPIKGNPGLSHRTFVWSCAYVWKVTTGTPPSTTDEGPFYRYVMAASELLPSDCRPKKMSPATIVDWTDQYRKRLGG